MMSVLYLLLTYLAVCQSDVLDNKNEFEIKCRGSLVLNNTDGEERTFDSDQLETDEIINTGTIKISSVRVEGCGCFYIYSRTRGRGASEFILSGEKWSADEFGFSKARSLEQVSCEKSEKNAMPVWGVVLTVLVLVAFVAIGAVIFIRYRKYREVSQNPS